jgi:DNA helicase-2/ATP-dependent DNA helicase PcrA
LRFAKKEDEELSKKKAEKVIKNYLSNYKEDVDLSLETEKPFEMILGNALISGQIDLIRRQTPKGEEITIVEFKTELDPDEFRKNKHKDQVLLYGLAYEKSFGKKPENLFVHYLDESKGKREEVNLNKENTNQVINKINHAVEEIKKDNFPRTPCEKSRCAICNFKLICKGAK